MQATLCRNCGTPLAPGAPFCGSCGTRVELSNQAALPPMTPPPAPLDPTLRANTPPLDPYAAQYPAQPSQPAAPSPAYPSSGPNMPGAALAFPSGPQRPPQYAPPPPPYASGPPPVMTPGSVAPWAQPPKKRRGGRVFIVLLVLLLLVAALGGGAYFLLHRSAKTGTTGTQSTTGTNSTPGAGSTPGSSSGQQTLTTINRQAIYSGVTVTILSALETKSVPEFQLNNPDQNEVLKLQAKLNNQSPKDVYVSNHVSVVDAAGDATAVALVPIAGALPAPTAAQTNATGFLYFEVPKGLQIAAWKVVLGAGTEAQETVPLTGAYDPSLWQETLKPIGKSVGYHDHDVVATVVKVTTGVWTPTGYQALQGMRFILVDLAVANKTAIDVSIGDPEFVVQFPDGQRLGQDSGYGYFINDVLGAGQSKDEGYACFVAPTAPGDFVMLFYNTDGSLAGQVDLGTL